MKNRQLHETTALWILIAAGLLPVSGAAAQTMASAPSTQTQTAAEPEEIIVTARRRDERLLEVPISMQAFSSAQIQAAGITDLNTLQAQAGFTFQQAASTQAGGREFPTIVMRGLQATYGSDQQGDSGSLFIDGIFVSAGLASINTADVKQIEVLKGPQNVYFGKGTFGGAINFITENPTDTFQGSAEASISARGSTNDVVMIEGPLVPGLLSGRLTVQNYDKAAEYHTSDGGDLGAEATRSITGTLYSTPSDKLWLRFRGHYQQDDDSAADLGFIPGSVFGSNCSGGRGTTASGAPATVKLAAPYFCGTIPSFGQTGTSVLDQNTAIPSAFAQSLSSNDFGGAKDPILGKVPSLSHSGLRRDLTQLAGQGGYELPMNANLNVNIGYNQSRSLDIWDLDRSPNGIFINAQPIASHDLTLDARVTSDQSSKIRALLGVSYFYSRYEISQDDDNFYNYAPTQFLYSGTSVQTSSYTNETDKTAAVFGSVDVDIISWLTATAEARYQHDRISDTLVTGPIYSKAFDNLLPRFTLKYHPRQDWVFYGSYSQGVQEPSLQTGYLNATPAQQAYLATIVPGASPYTPLAKLHTWEIGAKQSLFSNRVQYSIALYDEKWLNQQTTSAVFNPAGCGQTQMTAQCPLSNAGSFLYLSNNAHIQGIELSGSALITSKWSADLNVDYKRARWDTYYNSTLSTFTGGVSYFDGNTISRVPAWQGVVSSTYRDHLVGDWEWYVRGQMTYTGSMYESEINIGKTAPYERVNASLGVTRGNLNVEVYVKNLFDDKNWDFASRVPELENSADLFSGYSTYMGVLVQAPDRRDVGVKVNYKF